MHEDKIRRMIRPQSPEWIEHWRQVREIQLPERQAYIQLKDKVEDKKIRRSIEQQYF
jgi:hypothetical protein